MRKIVFIACVTLFCQNVFGQDLRIEVTNKTGFDIDSVAVSSHYIGLLKKDDSITVGFNEITMQDGNIMGFPKGYIKAKKRHRPRSSCETLALITKNT